LPDDLVGRVKSELVPGERILWAGRSLRPPARAIHLRWLVVFLPIPVALFVLGLLSILGLRGGRRGDDDLGGTIVLLIISAAVAVGMLMGIADTWADRRLRPWNAYALTDRRAIVWLPKASGAVEIFTYPARSIGLIHRTELPDGSGDVIFRGNVPHHAFQGFAGVAEVRRVEALAREVLIDPDYRYREPGETG
jgi:hypothetical protein